MDTTNPTPPADATPDDIHQAAAQLAQLAAASTPADWHAVEAAARWIAEAAAEQARAHVAPAATAPVLAAAGSPPRPSRRVLPDRVPHLRRAVRVVRPGRPACPRRHLGCHPRRGDRPHPHLPVVGHPADRRTVRRPPSPERALTHR